MQYTVIFASRVDAQLLKHVEFLARVSIPAAKAFRSKFAEILAQLEENPFLFPPETDPNLPAGLYRKALFAKRYKACLLYTSIFVIGRVANYTRKSQYPARY